MQPDDVGTTSDNWYLISERWFHLNMKWELRDYFADAWWHWLQMQRHHRDKLRSWRVHQPGCANWLQRFYRVHYLMV